MGPSSRTRSFVPVLPCHVSVQIWFPLSISEGIPSKGWMTKWPFGIFGKQTLVNKHGNGKSHLNAQLYLGDCPLPWFRPWHHSTGSACCFWVQVSLPPKPHRLSQLLIHRKVRHFQFADFGRCTSERRRNCTELLIRKQRWDKEILAGYQESKIGLLENRWTYRVITPKSMAYHGLSSFSSVTP